MKKVLIIGGGTAGLVIANKLQKNFDVVILEQSKYKKYPILYKIPLLIGLLFKKDKSKYISKLQMDAPGNRKVPFFKSNVLGGSSVVNGCVHTLGSKKLWLNILEKFNFTYDDLMFHYKNIFTYKLNEKNKITLKKSKLNIIDDDFINTLVSKGFSNGDMNYANNKSCGHILNTVSTYFRTSILSLVGKTNFEIELNQVVKGFLLDNNDNIVGVRSNCKEYFADYLILSGGVEGTCKLLLQEKLKHKLHYLNEFNANNIKDHTNLRINVLTNKSIESLNEISGSFIKKIHIFFKHILGFQTLMSGTGATSAANLDLDGDGIIDTRIQIVKFSETGRAGSGKELFSSSNPGFSISITAMNPKSSGMVKLNANESIIDPQYLSNKDDIELLKKALIFCMNLLQARPLADHVLQVESENMIINNPEEYIINNVFSGFHLIGGTQNLINDNFLVNNTDNLYICDASILDKYPASNIHSSVVLLASLFSQRFMENN